MADAPEPVIPPPAVEALPQTKVDFVDAPPKPQRKKFQRPNYAKIHAKPLPLETYPLPAFIPHSPLSLLRLAATILHHYFSPPNSHPSTPYIGYFSSESRSIHVTDPAHVRALWEMGFFGKGTLSRSEPNWLTAEKARLKAEGGGGTAEEATRKRREERRMFKLERARLEREQIEQQLKQERAAAVNQPQPLVPPSTSDLPDLYTAHEQQPSLAHIFPWQTALVAGDSPAARDEANEANDANEATPLLDVCENTILEGTSAMTISSPLPDRTDQQDHEALFEPEEPIVEMNQEHLQLTLEEAFFLTYGLGVLDVRQSPDSTAINNNDLFTLSWKHSLFPVATDVSELRADDPFLVNYAVYHYYRSLGWVVRPGVKFSADYMLYNRGPVFSHAEFAVIIIPEYSEDAPADERKQSRDWWWLHCVNRVQSQVRKSLVICYVEVPTMAALKAVGEGDIGAILRQYKVREFVLRRWLANRSRD